MVYQIYRFIFCMRCMDEIKCYYYNQFLKSGKVKSVTSKSGTSKSDTLKSCTLKSGSVNPRPLPNRIREVNLG